MSLKKDKEITAIKLVFVNSYIIKGENKLILIDNDRFTAVVAC